MKAVPGIVLLTSVILAGCGGGQVPAPAPSVSAPTASPSASVKPAASSAAPASASAKPAASAAASAQAGGVSILVAPNSSKLDVNMKEVLAGNTITTGATESTQAVSGQINLDGTGAVQPGSKITMDLKTLASDRSTRDNFIKGRFVLDTGNFPNVEFVPTEVQGLTMPLPSSGSASFKLLGHATVKGTTKPMTWDVTATFDGAGCSGQATSAFKLSDFGLSIPKLPTVLSVEDQGQLALSFKGTKES